jgi:hypothetical protein
MCLLEELHRSLMLLRCFPRGESAQVTALSVLESIFLEYKRYSPDFSFRIMSFDPAGAIPFGRRVPGHMGAPVAS